MAEPELLAEFFGVHREFFRSVRTGERIGIRCNCSIGHDHDYERVTDPRRPRVRSRSMSTADEHCRELGR